MRRVTIAEHLIRHCKIMFAEYGLPFKIVLNAGTNFVSEKCKESYRKLNIGQAITLSHNHQNSAQAEACTNFVSREH